MLQYYCGIKASGEARDLMENALVLITELNRSEDENEKIMKDLIDAYFNVLHSGILEENEDLDEEKLSDFYLNRET